MGSKEPTVQWRKDRIRRLGIDCALPDTDDLRHFASQLAHQIFEEFHRTRAISDSYCGRAFNAEEKIRQWESKWRETNESYAKISGAQNSEIESLRSQLAEAQGRVSELEDWISRQTQNLDGWMKRADEQTVRAEAAEARVAEVEKEAPGTSQDGRAIKWQGGNGEGWATCTYCSRKLEPNEATVTKHSIGTELKRSGKATCCICGASHEFDTRDVRELSVHVSPQPAAQQGGERPLYFARKDGSFEFRVYCRGFSESHWAGEFKNAKDAERYAQFLNGTHPIQQERDRLRDENEGLRLQLEMRAWEAAGDEALLKFHAEMSPGDLCAMLAGRNNQLRFELNRLTNERDRLVVLLNSQRAKTADAHEFGMGLHAERDKLAERVRELEETLFYRKHNDPETDWDAVGRDHRAMQAMRKQVGVSNVDLIGRSGSWQAYVDMVAVDKNVFQNPADAILALAAQLGQQQTKGEGKP